MVIRLMLLLVLVPACYDPIEDVHCFSDGANLPGSARATDVCCDVAASDGGRSTCSAFFSDGGYSAEIALTAVCMDPGFCVLPCPDGACACVVDRDCLFDDAPRCAVLASAQACDAAGLTLQDGHCTACAQCASDADCDGTNCQDGACR